METIGKLIYYIDNVRKVSIISITPFFVGSAEYCNLKITYKEKQGFFRIDQKGSFFTITNLDENSNKLFLNGEKVKKKMLLTHNSEIIYDNIKFVFEKEKKEVVSLYTTNRIQETLRGLQFKLRFNLPFIIIAICIISISATLFLFYRNYLDELEETAYQNIITAGVNSDIRRAEDFLKKFPSSKYNSIVRKYITDMKNLEHEEEVSILNAVKTKNIQALKELMPKLKRTSSKLLLLDTLLEYKINLDNANDIMTIISTIKDFESIKQSPSVSLSYNKIDNRIGNANNTEKILWLNLKNIYDAYINNRFRQDLQTLRKFEKIDIELKCTYLENLLYFYDVKRFVDVLEKEEASCTLPKQNNPIKIPKTLFTNNKSLKKIKKYHTNFIRALNKFDIQAAYQNAKIFVGLAKKLDIDVEKYENFLKSIQNIIQNKVKFSSTTCDVDINKITNPQDIQNIVEICLFLEKTNLDKLAVNVYKHVYLQKQQKIEILSKIFKLETPEDFKLIKNKLIPLSIYSCEMVKKSSTLSTFHAALNKVIEITNNKHLNMDNLRRCLTDILPTKIAWFKNTIKENLESNRQYLKLYNVRNLLDKARNEALGKIFDENFYTYDLSKNDHGENAQPEIDKLVNKVQQIWDNPVEFLDKDAPTNVKNLLEICRNIEEMSNKIKLPIAKVQQDSICFFLNYNIGANLKGFVLNDKEKKVRDWDKEAQEYNEKFQNLEEKGKIVIKVINEYRNMMGLQSLKLEKALIDAAKHHAKYLVDGGTFGHTEEDEKYKDPLSRARSYGFKGGMVGENVYAIAFGNNKSINSTSTFKNSVFEGWYKSSGHHRFLLCKCCKYAGIARASKESQSLPYNKEFWVFVAGCE